jgi:hypothetical protein
VVLDLLLVALLLLLVLPFLLLSPLFDPDHDRKNNTLDLKDLHLTLLMMHLPLMGQQRGNLARVYRCRLKIDLQNINEL